MSAGAVIAASTLESRSLAARTAEAEQKVARFATEELAPVLEEVDLNEEIRGDDEDRLTSQLEGGVLSGGSVVRVRVYAPNGALLYSSDQGDRVGSTTTGSVDLIRAAAAGALASVTGSDQVVTGGRAQSLQLLQVYAPLEPDGPSPASIGVDLRYRALAVSASQPWETVQLVGAIAAALLLLLTLFELARAIAAKNLAARSGFTGVDAERAAARASGKEATLRRALEDQIESVRGQLRTREEEHAKAAQHFASQLEEMSRRMEDAMTRADQAERRTPTPQAPQPALEDVEARLRAAEAALEKERQRSAATEDARAALEAKLALVTARAQLEPATPPAGPTPDSAAEEIQRLRAEDGEHETDDDRSLRFRLAQGAARKKSLGPDEMWS